MINEFKTKTLKTFWPRSTMDSIRVSEALGPRSIRGEATTSLFFGKHVPLFISLWPIRLYSINIMVQLLYNSCLCLPILL